MAKKKRNWVQIVSFITDTSPDKEPEMPKVEKKTRKRKVKGGCGC